MKVKKKKQLNNLNEMKGTFNCAMTNLFLFISEEFRENNLEQNNILQSSACYYIEGLVVF